MSRTACLALLLSLSLAPAAAAPQAASADAPTTTTATPALSRWGQHYLDRVEKFRQENMALAPGERYCVFVGDSLTEGLPLARLFPDVPTLNRGIISDGLRGAEPAVPGLPGRLRESVFDCQPRAVFLLIGTNDMPHVDKPLEFFEERYRAVVEEIRAKAPEATLVLTTLPPTGERYRRHAAFNPRARAFNVFLRNLAREQNLPLVDLEPVLSGPDGLLRPELTGDGLHLTPHAQELWAQAVREAIRALPASGRDSSPAPGNS